VAELSSDEDDDDDMGEPDEDFNAPYVSKPKKPAKDKAKDKVKDRDRGKEEEEPEKDSAEDDETPATLQDVESIKLSRHKLALWCHEPFFEKTVVGGLALGVGWGWGPRSLKPPILPNRLLRARVPWQESGHTGRHVSAGQDSGGQRRQQGAQKELLRHFPFSSLIAVLP
jgi:hypothetical protein